MTRLEKLALSLMKPINPSIIIILGLYTMIWGFWIFNPWWSVFSQAQLYSSMAVIGGEWLWGSIAIVAGMVITRGAVKPSYFNLHVGAFVAFLHWFTIAVLYFMGDWTNTGGITALTFAIYAGIVWINIKVNRKLYESK
jgi:hypothetical protein